MSRRTPWPLAALLIVALAAPPALAGKKQARRLRRDVTSLAKKWESVKSAQKALLFQPVETTGVPVPLKDQMW